MSRAAGVQRIWASSVSLATLVLGLAASCAGKSVRHVERDAGDASAGANGGDEAGVGAAGPGGTGARAGASSLPASAVPLEVLPDALAEALCFYGSRCGVNLYWNAWPGGCGALMTPLFRNTTAAQIAAGTAAGTMLFDPVRAADCVANIRNLACDAAWPTGFECPGGIDGTIQNGATCSYDLECAGDAYCADACPGTCVPRGRDGDVCGLGIQCTQGTYCLVDQVGTSRCSPLNGEGGGCWGLCRGALACDFGSGPPNACVARKFVGPGEPCDTTFALCKDGTVCAAAIADDEVSQSVCRPRVASGATCRFSTPEMCPDGEVCSLPHGTKASGTCVRTAAPGDACNPGDCGVHLTCVEGHCHAELENGEACTSNAQCWSYGCVEGICTVPACGPDDAFPEHF